MAWVDQLRRWLSGQDRSGRVPDHRCRLAFRFQVVRRGVLLFGHRSQLSEDARRRYPHKQAWLNKYLGILIFKLRPRP
jgi:hypothetical protein